MPRVAVITGGSRGIGAAISVSLKHAGYNVAALYAGNDDAAAEFSAQTAIKTYKWDVANYDACAAGIAQVEADLGPVEILVNNAGITHDAPFHKMTRAQWQQVIDTNLSGVFNMTHPVSPGMRDRKFGRIITISSINGQRSKRPVRTSELCRLKGRRSWDDQITGSRLRPRNSHQHCCAWHDSNPLVERRFG